MSVQTTLDTYFGLQNRGRECYQPSKFREKYPRLWQQLVDEAMGPPYPGQIMWMPNLMVVVTKQMRVCIIYTAPIRVDVYD